MTQDFSYFQYIPPLAKGARGISLLSWKEGLGKIITQFTCHSCYSNPPIRQFTNSPIPRHPERSEGSLPFTQHDVFKKIPAFARIEYSFFIFSKMIIT